MTRLTQLFLLLSGIGFMLIGVNTFRDPVAAMAGVELGVPSISALNEIRASYGGLQIGIGLLLVSAAFMTWLTRPALLVLSLVTGGLVELPLAAGAGSINSFRFNRFEVILTLPSNILLSKT